MKSKNPLAAAVLNFFLPPLGLAYVESGALAVLWLVLFGVQAVFGTLVLLDDTAHMSAYSITAGFVEAMVLAPLAYLYAQRTQHAETASVARSGGPLVSRPTAEPLLPAVLSSPPGPAEPLAPLPNPVIAQAVQAQALTKFCGSCGSRVQGGGFCGACGVKVT